MTYIRTSAAAKEVEHVDDNPPLLHLHRAEFGPHGKQIVAVGIKRNAERMASLFNELVGIKMRNTR